MKSEWQLIFWLDKEENDFKNNVAKQEMGWRCDSGFIPSTTKQQQKLGVAVHICNPGIQEVETE